MTEIQADDNVDFRARRTLKLGASGIPFAVALDSSRTEVELSELGEVPGAIE